MSDRYGIELTRRAEKDLNAFKQDRDRVVREIQTLKANPLAGHALKGTLRGARALEFNLKGGGAYRAVYTIVDNERVCIVFVVGSHENIYKVAERRYAALLKSMG
ncbi:MAG: type II toxin-antitoxin system RelE/ParE family toxin [Chloroflexia bacterium]|nr:type II toxin-antitoxin system RelE/ParE family toxin [Chloroflexia bacterium]